MLELVLSIVRGPQMDEEHVRGHIPTHAQPGPGHHTHAHPWVYTTDAAFFCI